MALSRFPTYLRLVGETRQERRANEPARVLSLPAWNRDLATGVASRQVLLERLATIGELAPRAPLSFVAVQLDLEDEIEENAYTALENAVTAKLVELSRATDMVGRMDDGVFGVALQGTGATAAGAVASRFAHHLNRLPELPQDAVVIVSAATGTGMNAHTLAMAAIDSFEQCAG